MRGADEQPGAMFSYVSLEDRVPADHPLRAIRRITDRALERISPKPGSLYIHFGRPSIPPERLLRALVLQALYTIRSERQLMEQLDYNLLFRWFVGLGIDDAVLIHADMARLLSDSTSRSTAPCWRRGPVRRVFGRAIRTRRPPAAATCRWTFITSATPTRRTRRPPIPMRACIRRLAGGRLASGIWTTS